MTSNKVRNGELAKKKQIRYVITGYTTVHILHRKRTPSLTSANRAHLQVSHKKVHLNVFSKISLEHHSIVQQQHHSTAVGTAPLANIHLGDEDPSLLAERRSPRISNIKIGGVTNHKNYTSSAVKCSYLDRDHLFRRHLHKKTRQLASLSHPPIKPDRLLPPKATKL